MYLANIFFHDPDEWNALKVRLEAFGRESGLFDEIAIRSFGKKDSEPFQVQVRKYARTLTCIAVGIDRPNRGQP